jgi:hypothetical protein
MAASRERKASWDSFICTSTLLRLLDKHSASRINCLLLGAPIVAPTLELLRDCISHAMSMVSGRYGEIIITIMRATDHPVDVERRVMH